MAKKYEEHIIKEGARVHVVSYLGIIVNAKMEGVQHCSEANCEVNKRYDELVKEGVIEAK